MHRAHSRHPAVPQVPTWLPATKKAHTLLRPPAPHRAAGPAPPTCAATEGPRPPLLWHCTWLLVTWALRRLQVCVAGTGCLTVRPWHKARHSWQLACGAELRAGGGSWGSCSWSQHRTRGEVAPAPCWPCAPAAGGLGGSGALWPVSERGHCWPGLKLLLPQGCPYVPVRPCHSRNRSAWPEGPFASLPGSRDPPSRPSIPGTPRASHRLPASPPQGSPSLFSP